LLARFRERAVGDESLTVANPYRRRGGGGLQLRASFMWPLAEISLLNCM
jgi:hypothetical protein